jgi:hypothetical protein
LGFGFPEKAVVILVSPPIVRRSTLPRCDDLRTWFRSPGLYQRVRSRKIDNGTNSSLNKGPEAIWGKNNAKSY